MIPDGKWDNEKLYKDLIPPVQRGGAMDIRCKLALIENIARRLQYITGPVYERPLLLQPGQRTDPDKEITSGCYHGDVPF